MQMCRTRRSMSLTTTCRSTAARRSWPAGISPRPSRVRCVDSSTSKRADARDTRSSPFGVGPTPSKKIRFTGVPLGEWASTNNGAIEHVRVFGTRSGKYVIHTERSEGFTMVDSQGKPAGWRGHLGIGDVSYGTIPARSTLDIVDDLDGVRDKVPPPLYDIVVSTGPPGACRGPRGLIAGPPPSASRAVRHDHHDTDRHPRPGPPQGLRRRRSSSTASTCTSPRARSSPCSARTGPARRPRSRSCPR